MIPIKRYLILLTVLGLSLGLVTVALAAADHAKGESSPEVEITHSLASIPESAILAPNQAVNPGFTVDLTRGRIWGVVNPGEVVTVSRTMGGAAYGAAEADGAGFFWTTLYDGSGNGQIVGIFGNDTLDLYVNGALIDTISPMTITGGIDVLADQVTGNIDGAGAGVPVTVTVGLWGNGPQPGAPFETTTTNASGDFSVTFTNMDLGAENFVAVDYQTASGNYVRAYLYPDPHVFLVQQFQTIAGYAPRAQNIHATVYVTYPTDIRWEGDQWAGWPHGFYQFNGVDVAPADLVELSFDDGTVISGTLTNFGNFSFDTVADQVIGEAPDGAIVRASMWQWQGSDLVYTETHATASGGSFTATFGADLYPRNSVDLVIANANGHQTQFVSGPPFIDARMEPTNDWDCVFWRVDGPNLPVTLTIETDQGIFTRDTPFGPSDLGNTGGWEVCYLIWNNGQPIGFSPGNTVTLETPSWSGSLVLADLAWMADPANDAIVGQAPDGEIEATVHQWNNDQYPVNGFAVQMTTAASPFNATFSDFDVRDSGSVEVRYFDPTSDFATRSAYWDLSMRYFQANLPYGVEGWTPVADEMITAWLYDSDGTSLLASTSQDYDGDPWRFWYDDFQGYSLEPGYWITLTSYGYFVAAEGTFSLGTADLTTNLNFENSDNVTHMLVRNFTGSDGDDLDTDDDGNLDTTPWDEVVDCVALIETVGSGEQVYCENTVGPDGSFVPGQVFACSGSWHIGQFDPVNGDDTPNNPNNCDGSTSISISEIRIDQTGTDNDEYFELTGAAGDSLDGLTYIVIGDGTVASGVIESVTDLSGNSIPLAGGWSASLQIPYMTVDADPDIDLVWGQAPKSQVLLEGGREDSGFYRYVPVDDYALDTARWGHDLQEGDWIAATYSHISGNRVRQEYFWPRVRMEVNYAHDWVQVETTPNAAITVTVAGKAMITGTAQGNGWFNSGDWPWNPEHPNIEVGDVITAEAVGLQSTVDPIGRINADADFDVETIAGTIEAPWFPTVTVSCEVWDWGGPSIVITNVVGDGGSYFCDFAGQWDLEPGGPDLAVRYTEPDGDQVINIIQTPWMRVNYAHDWVAGDYEAGHTFWITVTNNAGDIVRGTAEVDSWPGGGWQGDGFEVEWWQWDGGQSPDIQVDDWVYFQSDDGYYNEMRVGEISGTLDIDADSVSGPIYANWFTETLYVECHPWGAPGPAPGKDSNAAPDGTVPYFCQWDPNTEWDIQPGQEVAVMYVEPDLDRVINVFRQTVPDLRIEKWAEGSGQAMPGGPVIYTIRYVNDGDGDATTFTITDTLPLNTAYAFDTSGVVPTVGMGWVSWDLGPLAPGEEGQFQLYLTNSANPGDWLHNEADVYVEFDSNPDNNHAEADVEVVDDVPDLYVNKDPNPGDPTPGQTMLWQINYGNTHGVASGFVVLTDTIPADTTIVSWYSANGYNIWSDYGSTADQLILAAPSIPGNWGDTLILRLAIDPGVEVGTQITNTVEIFTAEEDSGTLEDNFHLRDDVWVSDPRWDGYLDKNFGWGQLVPGGELEYNMHVRNQGNMATTFWLTDTLPVSTTFVASWLSIGPTQIPFPPDYMDGEIVSWDIGNLEPGEWVDINLRLQIDAGAAPGTVIENCAEIDIDGLDSWPVDNTDCVEDTVRDLGPNLRVNKDYWWNWEGSLNYNINIENIGSEWLDNVWITDTYPTSTNFNWNWWVNHGPWITVTLDDPNNQLIFWVDELSPGETASVGFNVDLDGGLIGVQGLAFTNTVDAPIPGDVYPADNYDEVVAYTGPDVYIEKWLSDGELRPGEIVTFTVEFGNQNFWPWSGDDQYGSHITETLPQAMSFITATAPWDPNQTWTPEVIDGNTIVWGWGTMWPESTWYFDLVVQITDTVEGGDVITNRIEAYGDSPDDVEYNWENNVFELPLTILGPSFEVAKTYETNMVAGTDVVYTVTVTNTGNEAGTTVVLSDTVPANLTYGGSDGTLVGGDVLWTFASVAPDGGTASGWFSGTIACPAGLTVDNEHYRVVSSDQGVVSEDGDLVSFLISAPTITADFIQSAGTILVGESVTFTSTATTDGTGLSYAWTFGDGGNGNGEIVAHTYVTTGTYDVALTVTDTCGYTDTITIEDAVTVVPVPVPDFAVAKTYETSMVAGTDVVYSLTVTNTGNEAGTTVVLSDTVPANLTYGGSDGTLLGGDVLWTFASVAPDGGTGSGWFSGTLACTAGLTVDNEHYRVVSSDQGLASEEGDLVSFTIISPTITVSFTQSAGTIYAGGQVDFTAMAATDGTSLTYAWDFGDGFNGSGEAASHIYLIPGVYDVTLTVTDGCGYSETITIEDAVTVEMVDFLIYLPVLMR